MRSDSAGAAVELQRAAGVILLSGGKILLLKRSGEGDHPGKYCFPGGGIEEGETAEQAALRECQEEIGFAPSSLKLVGQTSKHGVDFSTFIASHPEQTEPTLNGEHDSFAWASIDEAANLPLHPGCADTLGIAQDVRSDAQVTELDIAIAIRDGKAKSPQTFSNITLFDVRITGTGVACRVLKGKDGKKTRIEYVMRDPALYLNDRFLMRCQGLPVIIEHPEIDVLNSKEFSDRIVGTILLPYIKGNEVWGIAKVYDDSASQIMSENELSTSPSVVFRDPAANEVVELEDGNHLLIEGEPSLLDHLAIVHAGVWDKGGKPSGIKSSTVHASTAEASRADSADQPCTTLGEKVMADTKPEVAAKKDGEGEVSLGDIMSAIQSLGARLDQLESAEAAEVKPDAEQPAAAAAIPAAPAAASPDNAVPSPAIKAIADRLDTLEAKTAPVPEAEAAAMADAQAKADSVYQSFGDAAPRPMIGESLLNYRKRLLKPMMKHSKDFSGVNLDSISDPGAIAAIEGRVFSDSIAVAASPAMIPAGVLMETSRKDATGRTITEFKGSPSAWTNMFKAPKGRLTRINKQVH